MLTRVIRAHTPGVRAKRINLAEGIVVESKTIGTILSYNMATENLSRTGMLLNPGRNKRLPFQVNTLLELTVDAPGALFERPVSCLGRIVRANDGDSGEKRFGIHIVQIDARDMEVWERGVIELEASLPEKQQLQELTAG